MASVNKVILVGNLGADPEVKSFRDGGRIANMRLATSETWKDRNSGERKERVEWHSVVVTSDGLIGVVERYLRKGSKVYVEGQLRTRRWQDQSGNDRYSTEVVIGGPRAQLVMLDGAQGEDRGERQRGDDRRGGDGSRGSSSNNWGSNDRGGSTGGDWGDDLDDEIPFCSNAGIW